MCLPCVVPPVYKAVDGPLGKGLRLESEVVRQIFRRKVDPTLSVNYENEPIQRLKNQRPWNEDKNKNKKVNAIPY